MGTIIIIAIIVYIFRDLIFGFLGWLLERFEDLLDFIVDVKDKIVDIHDSIKRKKYEKECERIRQQRLVDIDNEYAEQNYKRVISMFREVMKDDLYSLADRMKYCHIAADSVCHVAETIQEWEEARTWTMILKKRYGSCDKEADALFKEITDRGGDVFDRQGKLLSVANALIQGNDYETAIKLLTEASDNGSFAALCTCTTLIIDTMGSDADTKEAKRWIEKVRNVDKYSAREFDSKYSNAPYVKYSEHYNKSQKYIDEAKNAQGDKFISLTEKAVLEWQKAYKYASNSSLSSAIMKTYILLAEQQKQYHPKGNDSFDIYARYYKNALEWAKIAAEDGDEEAKKTIKALEAQVEVNDLAVQITESKNN